MNKRGQIATTGTWIVGTLIIIVILGIFLAITNYLSAVHQITPGGLSISNVDLKTSDLFLSKSFSAYLLTEERGKTMYFEAKNEKNINSLLFSQSNSLQFVAPNAFEILVYDASQDSTLSSGFKENEYFDNSAFFFDDDHVLNQFIPQGKFGYPVAPVSEYDISSSEEKISLVLGIYPSGREPFFHKERAS